MSPDPSPVAVAVAFCPHPPQLVPAPAGSSAPEVDRVRVACGEALQTVLGLRPDVVLVVGDGPAGVRYGPGDAGDLAEWGGTGRQPFAGRVRPGGRALPLPHTVGAWLLDQAGHDGIRLGVAPGDLADALAHLPGPVGILAMGDGSARRASAAPGGPDADPAAADFDAGVAEALRAGDPAALAALDVATGDRLHASGTSTWTAVGAALSGRAVTGRLLQDGAPAGVGWLVADWLLADVPDGVPGWLQP